MKPLYLYAIVRARPRASFGKGAFGGGLRAIDAGPFAVVAERAHAPEATTENLRAHDLVVRRIAERASAVLPFRFGAVVEDAARVASLVDPVAPLVDEALARVDDCVQYTLRVHGEPARRRRAKGGPGTRFLAERLEARRVPEIAAVTRAVSRLVRATRAERHDRPPLLASVYHLVPRANERRYLAALARAEASLGAVRVRISGPFPPYAFSELA